MISRSGCRGLHREEHPTDRRLAGVAMAGAVPPLHSSRSSIAVASRALPFSSFRSTALLSPRLHRPRSFSRFRPVRAYAASSPPLQVCVKESLTSPGKLGDCPFSQRILLTLEEKRLAYDLKLVDLANKPEWFLAINPEGKVPAVKLEEKWISDSDVIAHSLEEKFPDQPLVTPPEKVSVGTKIFSTFIGFLASKDPNDGKEEALITELTAFNDYIKENGPFINGNMITAADLSLGPKLYHMEIALDHYKTWSLPECLTHVKDYMKAIFSRDSFIKTRALPEDVIAGWRPKVSG